MEIAVFALFAFLAVISAIVVVSHRNPVYAVMSLVITLISLAVLFVLLGAPFIAAIQVLVYAGAILVLFLFVIMLLNVEEDAQRTRSGIFQKVTALISAALFTGILAGLFWRDTASQEVAPLTNQSISLESLAHRLFAAYLLPFEMIGLLLLAAVVAATVLAKPYSSRPRAEDP